MPLPLSIPRAWNNAKHLQGPRADPGEGEGGRQGAARDEGVREGFWEGSGTEVKIRINFLCFCNKVLQAWWLGDTDLLSDRAGGHKSKMGLAGLKGRCCRAAHSPSQRLWGRTGSLPPRAGGRPHACPPPPPNQPSPPHSAVPPALHPLPASSPCKTFMIKSLF